MPDDKEARRLESKEGETQSRTQMDPEGKLFDDEACRLEREEKEAWIWTQEGPEGRMYDDEARHLERKGSIHGEVDKRNGLVYATTRLTTHFFSNIFSTIRIRYTPFFIKETYHMEGRLNLLKKTQILGLFLKKKV